MQYKAIFILNRTIIEAVFNVTVNNGEDMRRLCRIVPLITIAIYETECQECSCILGKLYKRFMHVHINVVQLFQLLISFCMQTSTYCTGDYNVGLR